MASQQGATVPTRRSGGGDVHADPSPAPVDFEFCILSSGALAMAGDDAADMCVADEVFSGGKLLPLRLSSATSADASTLLLFRSESLDGATTAASSSGISSRSDSRSASSSSSSSVSRSTSSKSASKDPAGHLGSSSNSTSSFYEHPSPSPRPPRRSGLSTSTATRRSTGSAPPATWGLIRLGVVGAPEVYHPRATSDSRRAAAARGGTRSARFEEACTASKQTVTVDKKLGLGLLGAGLVCSCSPDAVAPVGSAEVSAAEARRRRKKAGEKERAAKQSGQSTSRRSRILEWLEELSISREKNVV